MSDCVIDEAHIILFEHQTKPKFGIVKLRGTSMQLNRVLRGEVAFLDNICGLAIYRNGRGASASSEWLHKSFPHVAARVKHNRSAEDNNMYRRLSTYCVGTRPQVE